MSIRPVLRGLATYLPVLGRHVGQKTGGTSSARYCYSVWLRHLVMAGQQGLDTCPSTIAELGPGDSLGIGLAGLLSGSDAYFAFDVMDFGSANRNLSILDELVDLYRARAPIPGPDEFPRIKPGLESFGFPAFLEHGGRLERALDPNRIDLIRASLANTRHARSVIKYCVPWTDADVMKSGTVDMIFSQAVLEHVDDLEGTYRAMRQWLAPRGFMSHQVDFKCHHTADVWNGHWTHSDLKWRLIRGRLKYLLNRQPYSHHRRLLRDHGFDLVAEQTITSESSLQRSQLAPRFADLTDADLVTSGAFFLAVASGT